MLTEYLLRQEPCSIHLSEEGTTNKFFKYRKLCSASHGARFSHPEPIYPIAYQPFFWLWEIVKLLTLLIKEK